MHKLRNTAKYTVPNSQDTIQTSTPVCHFNLLHLNAAILNVCSCIHSLSSGMTEEAQRGQVRILV